MLSPRYAYVRYDAPAAEKQAQLREAFVHLEKLVEGLDGASAGRAKALAHTKLEEAYMWIGKAIRDEQVARTESSEAASE